MFNPIKLMKGENSINWEEFWNYDGSPVIPPPHVKKQFNRCKDDLDNILPIIRTHLLDWATYKHWISLVLDDAPETVRAIPDSTDESKASSLGSIMLFSEQALSSVFLTEVRNWIQEIYLLFRQHESIRQAEEAGEAEHAAAVNQAISHEFKTIVPLISISKPWLNEHIQHWLLAFALPGLSSLDEYGDSPRLPQALYGNNNQTYNEWIKGLTILAAEIESMAKPGQSMHIPPSKEVWQANVNNLAESFNVDIPPRMGSIPARFEERCILGVAILCVFRNCLQHTTSYDPGEDEDGKGVYGNIRFDINPCIITCRLANAKHPAWGDYDLIVTNPHSGKASKRTGGSSNAIRYHLKQIAGSRHIDPYPFVLPRNPSNNEYITILPALINALK